MAKINLPQDDDFNDFQDGHGFGPTPDADELMDKASRAMFEDESDLKKEINKLKRWEKRLKLEHEMEIDTLRTQIQDLIKKNWELTEANNIFARGLEQLKQDHKIITESHTHHVIDTEGIKKKIQEITMPKFGPDLKKRVVGIITLKANNRNEATEILIVTEHIDKTKRGKDE
jgi:hypothetical protein